LEPSQSTVSSRTPEWELISGFISGGVWKIQVFVEPLLQCLENLISMGYLVKPSVKFFVDEVAVSELVFEMPEFLVLNNSLNSNNQKTSSNNRMTLKQKQ